jgi:putative flippase GtrA
MKNSRVQMLMDGNYFISLVSSHLHTFIFYILCIALYHLIEECKLICSRVAVCVCMCVWNNYMSLRSIVKNKAFS